MIVSVGTSVLFEFEIINLIFNDTNTAKEAAAIQIHWFETVFSTLIYLKSQNAPPY